MMVNKIWSAKTQLPYRYYDLPFCKPEHPQEVSENLGEILAGDRIESSDYELKMGQDKFCSILCRKVYGKSDAQLFATRIEEDYKVNWYDAPNGFGPPLIACIPPSLAPPPQGSGQPACRCAHARP